MNYTDYKKFSDRELLNFMFFLKSEIKSSCLAFSKQDDFNRDILNYIVYTFEYLKEVDNFYKNKYIYREVK